MFSSKRRFSPVFFLLFFVSSLSTALADGLEKKISLRHGQTNVVLEGQISEGNADKYVFEANVNQEITIYIVSESGNAFFTLQGSEKMGTFSGVQEEALANKWAGILPVKGDYTLTIKNQREKAFYIVDITFGKVHPIDKARNACLTVKKDLTSQEKLTCYEESKKQWEKVFNKIYEELLATEDKQFGELLKATQMQCAKFKEAGIKIFEAFFKTTSEEVKESTSWMVARIKMEMLRERVSVLTYMRRTEKNQGKKTKNSIPWIYYDEGFYSINRVLEKCLDPSSGILPAECYQEAVKKWDEELNLVSNTLAEKLKSDALLQLKETQGQWLNFKESEFKFIATLSKARKNTDYPFERAESAEFIRAGTLLINRYLNVLLLATASYETQVDKLEEDAKVRRITPAEQAELRAIINSAQSGDIIRLQEGIYNYKNAVSIANKENLTLEGEGEVWIIVENIKEDVIKIENSKRVFLKNIKARHQAPLATFNCEGAVVKIENSSQIWVTDCELNGSGAVGVYLDKGEDVIVNHCYIHHNTLAAFMLQDAKWVAIHDNTITENGSTLYTLSSENIRMSGNVIGRNRGEKGWSSPFTQEILQETDTIEP